MDETQLTMTFSWNDLERQLCRLADGPAQKEMIPYLVSGIRKQRPFLTHELLLQEILSVAACMADSRFPPPADSASRATATSPVSESSP